MTLTQPDITLTLDLQGVIQDAQLSGEVSASDIDSWIGLPWTETVADVGADKVRRMVEDARVNGVSAFRQINQRFPSGLELPFEYTTVSLGGQGGLVAVGKSLKAVANLQARLVAAQHAMEQDYWKLREVETRYRLLFDSSNDAVLLVRASNLHVVEANPAAIRVLGMKPDGSDLLAELWPEDRSAVQAMLDRVREYGKAPGLLVHLGRSGQALIVRASVMTSHPGTLFLLQLLPAGLTPQAPIGNDVLQIDELIERIPDGLVVIDPEGMVKRANRAFLDLVQVGAERAVIGERLGRWLSRPGADLKVLLSNVEQHGLVRLFSTSINGELGTEIEVEISAARASDAKSSPIGVLVRAVSHRLPEAGEGEGLGLVLGTLAEQVGKTPLSKLVKDTVAVVERHYIEGALELTGGNRTSTAELLGLSRQSLYGKLNRYGLDGSTDAIIKEG